jgi:beta-1,4-mannosyltransferase
MKVVDMFGTGLPVAGWSKFEAWPELVTEGVNGRGFGSAEELTRILEQLFTGKGGELARLKQGVLEEGKRRWDDEWMPVAGKLFELKAQ